MSTCKALIIPTDQKRPARVETIDTDLETCLLYTSDAADE